MSSYFIVLLLQHCIIPLQTFLLDSSCILLELGFIQENGGLRGDTAGRSFKAPPKHVPTLVRVRSGTYLLVSLLALLPAKLQLLVGLRQLFDLFHENSGTRLLR